MLRKAVLYVVLATMSVEAVGCAGKRAVVRGQSPDTTIPLRRLRGRIRRDVEPVLDATWKVHRKIEPALETTKDVAKKGLAVTGFLALLGGLWWLDQTYDDGIPTSAGNNSPPRSASGGESNDRNKGAEDQRGRREQGE
jgi:hypothetical protein